MESLRFHFHQYIICIVTAHNICYITITHRYPVINILNLYLYIFISYLKSYIIVLCYLYTLIVTVGTEQCQPIRIVLSMNDAFVIELISLLSKKNYSEQLEINKRKCTLLLAHD